MGARFACWYDTSHRTVQKAQLRRLAADPRTSTFSWACRHAGRHKAEKPYQWAEKKTSPAKKPQADQQRVPISSTIWECESQDEGLGSLHARANSRCGLWHALPPSLASLYCPVWLCKEMKSCAMRARSRSKTSKPCWPMTHLDSSQQASRLRNDGLLCWLEF